MDMNRVEWLVGQLLEEIDANPEREGLSETPKRVARMFSEIFEGASYTNDEIVALFNKCFEDVKTEDLVVVKDISTSSYCEHHMALMYNMKVSIGYLPNEKVIGLSKIARVVDMVCKRLQLQERIGTDVAYIISKICNTDSVAVVITSEHSCMSYRGIKKPGTKTVTATVRGRFKESKELRDEFYSLIKQ